MPYIFIQILKICELRGNLDAYQNHIPRMRLLGLIDEKNRPTPKGRLELSNFRHTEHRLLEDTLELLALVTLREAATNVADETDAVYAAAYLEAYNAQINSPNAVSYVEADTVAYAAADAATVGLVGRIRIPRCGYLLGHAKELGWMDVDGKITEDGYMALRLYKPVTVSA